jgi:hypothetical protein
MFDESREQFRKSYAAGGDAYQRSSGDRRVFITMLVIILLGSALFEMLARYTTWSFVPRIAVAVTAIGVAQYIAGRFFNRLPPKVGRY